MLLDLLVVWVANGLSTEVDVMMGEGTNFALGRTPLAKGLSPKTACGHRWEAAQYAGGGGGGGKLRRGGGCQDNRFAAGPGSTLSASLHASELVGRLRPNMAGPPRHAARPPAAAALRDSGPADEQQASHGHKGGQASDLLLAVNNTTHHT